MKTHVSIGKSRLLILTAVFVLSFALSGYAQNVKLQFNGSPLKTVLAKITQECGYNFVYSENSINPNTAISASYNGKIEPIKEVLDIIFSGTGITYKINGKQVALQKQETGSNTTQELLIKGKVYDESNYPIAGVNILNKSTNKYTTTDMDGAYSIQAKEGDQLSFTMIGMLPADITVGKKSTIDLEMQSDLIALESVVVTGYQDIQKEKVTGAISTVSSKKIEERYTPNIMNNLEGRVAGLTTYGGKTTIRGTSSLYAETSPLLVVDGLPIEGRIEDLNPYDIESINVLKDAAATAIYGARASNGIIVITTKNAKKEGKIDIDFSTNFTVWEKRNVDYSDNFYMTAAEQVKVESDYYEYYYFNNDGEVADPIGSTETTLVTGRAALSPIQMAYYNLAKGNITRSDLQATLEKLSRNNYAQEYADAIYKRQFLQQYNLALRSRSNKFQSNLTFNYKHDNSGIINAENSALNISYKGVYDIANWLTASFSINSVYGKVKEAGYDYNSGHRNIWGRAAYETLYNEDGSYRKFYPGTSGYEEWWENPENSEGLYHMGTIYRDEFYNNTVETKRQHIRYHGDLLFKLFKGLTANAQFIYEDNRQNEEWHANEKSSVARQIRNAYTIKDANGNVTYLTPRTGGMLRTTTTNGSFYTARGQANYTNTFGKHAVAAIAGLEFRQTKTNGRKSLVLGYDEQLQNSATHTVDFATLSKMEYSPWYMQGQYRAQQFVFDPYFEDGMGIVVEQFHRYASGYANLTYTYDNKYNVFGSFRKDYADVYGLNAKFRGKPLWSVGAAWNINNEEFMKDVTWVDFLKLRVSYGVTGNIYQGATSYITATSTGMNQYTNQPYGEIASPANPNLKWEQSRTTDIGIDFGILGNRFRGSIDWYSKDVDDIFSNKSIDPTTGFASMFMNTASMYNRGVELQLTADWFRERKRNDFGWSTSFTYSHNKNEVTSVENPAARAYELTRNPYKVGYPSSAIWSYRFAGISDQKGEEGQTLWYGDNDVIKHSVQGSSIDVLEYSGQYDPVTVMGMDNRFSFGGFSISVLMAYYGGHKMRALIQEETMGMTTQAIPSYFVNAWTPENPTDVPGIGRYSSTSKGPESYTSNISVHDADFLKIRNIVIGYELPERWLNHVGFNRASLRFQIDNPKALWVKNDLGVDPETLGLRNPSSFIFGININL